MKRLWILILLTGVFIWIIASRFTEIEELKNVLLNGHWGWILGAIGSQIVFYLVYVATFQSAFNTLDIQTSIRELVPITLGATFVNVAVPFGGASGVAVFTRNLKKRGKPTAGVATGLLLQTIANFVAFSLLLAPAMVYLYFAHDLQLYEIIAAMILLIMTIGLTSVLLMGMWKPEGLWRLLNLTQQIIKWLFGLLRRTQPLVDDWARRHTQEFSDGTRAATSNPLRLVRTVGLCFLAHLLSLVTLYILFLAFDQPIGTGALIAGYAVGILFLIVSITPQGIGVVEGMMTLVFTSFGITGAIAAMIALAFRGLNLWFPLVLGFFAMQHLGTVKVDRGRLTEI